MPLHRRHFDPWPYFDWEGYVDQNEPNDYHPPRLPPLYPQIQCVSRLGGRAFVLMKAVDRYEKRHKNLAAHLSPAFRVEVGDVVTVGM
jgi:hypothetical protein